MIRAQLVEHPEHGILRLRDDYYARQRALIGGVILAGALILGQILAQRIGENVFAQLTQMVVSAAGLAYGLIYAAWPNNPRQTSLAVAGGTGALCLLTLAGGLLVMVLISVMDSSRASPVDSRASAGRSWASSLCCSARSWAR